MSRHRVETNLSGLMIAQKRLLSNVSFGITRLCEGLRLRQGCLSSQRLPFLVYVACSRSNLTFRIPLFLGQTWRCLGGVKAELTRDDIGCHMQNAVILPAVLSKQPLHRIETKNDKRGTETEKQNEGRRKKEEKRRQMKSCHCARPENIGLTEVCHNQHQSRTNSWWRNHSKPDVWW